MINNIMVKFDYFMLRNYHRLPFGLQKYFDFPTKRLLLHCWKNHDGVRVRSGCEAISHMYTFDSTVNKDDLSLIFMCYDIQTKERVRMLLRKFIVKYYKKI